MTISKQNSVEVLTGHDSVSSVCEPVSLERGAEVGDLLMAALPSSAVGIAANQIGLSERVCFINVAEPILLINPVITSASGKVKYVEGCISFPGEVVKTLRYSQITVKADNYVGELLFDSTNLLECVCVQHEIDHLNGITMFDRRVNR